MVESGLELTSSDSKHHIYQATRHCLSSPLKKGLQLLDAVIDFDAWATVSYFLLMSVPQKFYFFSNVLKQGFQSRSPDASLSASSCDICHCCCCSVAQLFLTLCDPMDDARLPRPSLSPRVCSNSCPLSQWYYPTLLPWVFDFFLKDSMTNTNEPPQTGHYRSLMGQVFYQQKKKRGSYIPVFF